MPQAGCCVAVGLGYGCIGAHTWGHLFTQARVRLGCHVDMLSQHHAIGLQTGCTVVVLARVVEAARLPRVCPMALGYGVPPCINNNYLLLSLHFKRPGEATEAVRQGLSDGNRQLFISRFVSAMF